MHCCFFNASHKIKMKILVICQYYFPEPVRINDICEKLANYGHEVLVVTDEPNYPKGTIYNGYKSYQHKDEIINGVRVHRCPIIPRKNGNFWRVLNYFSYPYSAKSYVLSEECITLEGKPFDLVFVNQLSPVMMSEPAIAYKEKYNIPIIMYCLDLWPESLIVGGIKRNSFIYKYYHKVSERIYSKMDRILVSSSLFKSYLVNEFKIEDSKIDYLPQYAEDIFQEINPRKEDGITNFLFAGNIGTAQGLIIILEAAEQLLDYPIKFHIVGGGSDLKRLEKLAETRNLNNVKFYAQRPVAEMPLFYKVADAMIITLIPDPILSLTLPGKVQTYMAAGKPIIGAIDGETAEVIKNACCGFVGNAGNVEQFVQNIKRFLHCSAEQKVILGKNARNFYELHFEEKQFMKKLEETFNLVYT